MNYFLAKTDPDTYSIDQFEKDKTTLWDGVHNYQAINTIKSMKRGDMVFIYHSMSDKAILGLAEVVGEPYENKEDSRYSWAVEMKFIERIKPVTLREIKQTPELSNFLLIRNPRLSTMPVDENIAKWILSKR